MSKIIRNQFLDISLEQIPRLLGQLNRNPSSKSFGSFDRAYWHYRTNDISCARYQEAVYTLALLYAEDFEGNVYYHDAKLLEWIRASLRFTTTIQRKNGSFDEWYINEGSYVATAFLTAALAETLFLFRKYQIKISEESIILELLEKSARFLTKTQENTVMNQVSGAIFAIAAVGNLLENQEFTYLAARLAEKFVADQNSEGWWREYGGPDIGYLTLTISYLEKYRELPGGEETVTENVSKAIARAKDFVEFFIAPDGIAGGEYMSRNTEYVIPSVTLPCVGALKPSHLDDRYLCYILYNWIFAGVRVSPRPHQIARGEHYFPESGLLRVVNDSYFLVINAKKGGSLRLYSGDGVYYDSGLEIPSQKLSTGILDEANLISYKEGGLEVSGFAKKIKEPLLKTHIAIPFKSWQLVFGQISFLQKFVKDFLRPRMIQYSGHAHVRFERIISYTDRGMTITDVVPGEISRSEIILGAKSAYSAVPSSKYAPNPELANHLLKPTQSEEQNVGARIIKRIFTFNE